MFWRKSCYDTPINDGKNTMHVRLHEGKMSELTHLNQHGEAHMVDVGAKPDQKRRATARGHITLTPHTRSLILSGGLPKGDVLAVARIAGIMAAKKTSDLIPLCHPLAITAVDVLFSPDEQGIQIEATVATTGKTGVEMEALTAVSVAALTIYDMCKAVDKQMLISAIHLVEKTKSDLT
jgi:cyclic pyranopterin phosphate synthase